MLNEALLYAHQETKRLQKEWDKTDWMDKPVILAGSLVVGDAVHELALSIVHLLQDFQKLLTGTGDWLGRYTAYHEQLHRAWDKGDIDGVKRAVAALEAMENELDVKVDSGFESGKLIANLAIEPSFYKTIITFSYDYINALHIIAAVKLFPTVALNVALLLIGGAGAAKQGIKGAEKISAHLKQTAELFERKKYKKTLIDESVNTKVEIKPDGVVTSKIKPGNKNLIIISREQALINVKNEAKALGVEIRAGKEADEYLDFKAKLAGTKSENFHASALGDDLIMVRDAHINNPRVIREELIHTQQQKTGFEISNKSTTNAEIEVREQMIKNKNDWGITKDEVQEMIQDIKTIKERGYY